MFILIAGCAIEDPTACFEGGGDQTVRSVALESFSRVIVREGIALEIVHGTENSLTINHPENFMDDIEVKIIDDRLILENNSECKFFNGYKPARVRLVALDVNEIRNASQFTVRSIDTLRFDTLTIISEDFLEKEVPIGDFDLLINSQRLSIITNDVSNFYLSGKTQNFNINFASGQGKLESEKLEAQEIFLFHRGTNDLLVNPIQKISGEIRGTGNVIAVRRPAIVEVDEYYTGKLLFRN